MPAADFAFAHPYLLLVAWAALILLAIRAVGGRVK
jgi:hypothetical protein